MYFDATVCLVSFSTSCCCCYCWVCPLAGPSCGMVEDGKQLYALPAEAAASQAPHAEPLARGRKVSVAEGQPNFVAGQ